MATLNSLNIDSHTLKEDYLHLHRNLKGLFNLNEINLNLHQV